MHIFVAGGAGYIGSVLVPELLTQGHRVTVLDRLYFGDTLAKTQNRFGHHLAVVRGDIRTFDASLLGGVDAVVDLSGISNDPSCELEPEQVGAHKCSVETLLTTAFCRSWTSASIHDW